MHKSGNLDIFTLDLIGVWLHANWICLRTDSSKMPSNTVCVLVSMISLLYFYLFLLLFPPLKNESMQRKILKKGTSAKRKQPSGVGNRRWKDWNPPPSVWIGLLLSTWPPAIKISKMFQNSVQFLGRGYASFPSFIPVSVCLSSAIWRCVYSLLYRIQWAVTLPMSSYFSSNPDQPFI